MGAGKDRFQPFYATRRGRLFLGSSGEVLRSSPLTRYKGKVQLIFSSPPFPLNRKKKYGNEQGEAYTKWLAAFAPLFADLLTPTGSIVLEIGNAWEPGRPVQSLLPLKSLLAFLEHKTAGLRLCQEFICHNPARLPSPAQWVTIERVRVKDSFTRLWWMSKTDTPKANNRNVLVEYSAAMRQLLKSKSYNAGTRPSEHAIDAQSFLTDNGGAIPPNVLGYSNTAAFDLYLDHCREIGLKPHPARMQAQLPEFFIKFLTDKDDLVLDPFAGSNTTGATSENLGRRWLAIEAQDEYARASQARFKGLRISAPPPKPAQGNDPERTLSTALIGNDR